MINVKFEIEKGIALPQIKSSRGNGYPFAEMEVGDSFITENKSVSASSIQFCKKNPDKAFTSRKVEGGYRIWRVK